MLEVNNLSTFYGEFQALHGINMKAGDGSLVAIFGPNGHGKTTLLKTICGLIKPAEGEILYNGVNLADKETSWIVENGVVYIAEDRHLFSEMSILENLKLGAYNKTARSEEKRSLEFVFDLFPKLKVLSSKAASTLSGGEARMLAIGRGLMSNPSFLAIDEPSLGLAPKLRSEVFAKIRDIKESGKNILIVEQSTSEISDLADYIYLLEDGRIVHEGSSLEDVNDDHFKRVYLGIN